MVTNVLKEHWKEISENHEGDHREWKKIEFPKQCYIWIWEQQY